jgi:hypothetical protein
VVTWLLSLRQGDQIGRIFAYLPIVYLGQGFENYRNSANFVATFSGGKGFVLVFTKIVLGYILGDLFTNSSGHPALRRS